MERLESRELFAVDFEWGMGAVDVSTEQLMCDSPSTADGAGKQPSADAQPLAAPTDSGPYNELLQGNAFSLPISAVPPTDWQDCDRDGRHESLRVGRVQDGRVVQVQQDLDNDGYRELAWFDDNADGVWDYVWLDSDANGSTDWIWTPGDDANGDGQIQPEEWRRVVPDLSFIIPGSTSQVDDSEDEPLTAKVYPVADLTLPLNAVQQVGALGTAGGFGGG